MSTHTKHNTELERSEKITESYHHIELFYEQHKQKILTGLGIVVLVIGGLVIYKKLIKAPKEKEAVVQIAQAQLYFEQDSFRLALNGDGNYLGFKSIADKFKGTSAGNTARYYAGVCELQQGNFKGALSYFENFKTEDPMIQAMAFGCMGDAYMELNQTDKGKEYYKKAVEESSNNITAVIFLDRLAKVQEINKQYEDAIKSYEQVKNDFPESPEAEIADKNIIRLRVMMGQ